MLNSCKWYCQVVRSVHNLGELFQKITIIYHLYGTAGSLPGLQTNNSLFQVPFGMDNTNLLKASSSIKTFTKQINDNDITNNIQNAVSQAENIVFLGYAFHKQNLELLKPSNKSGYKRIYATAYGISDSNCQHIINDLKILFGNKNDMQFELRNDNRKCVELLQIYSRSLKL